MGADRALENMQPDYRKYRERAELLELIDAVADAANGVEPVQAVHPVLRRAVERAKKRADDMRAAERLRERG